jgi:hypothetical protein
MAVQTDLILKRASSSRSSGEWSEDDYDVIANGVVVGQCSRNCAFASSKVATWPLVAATVRFGSISVIGPKRSQAERDRRVDSSFRKRHGPFYVDMHPPVIGLLRPSRTVGGRLPRPRADQAVGRSPDAAPGKIDWH